MYLINFPFMFIILWTIQVNLLGILHSLLNNSWSDSVVVGYKRICCRKGDPFHGLSGLLSDTQKWIVWGDTCAEDYWEGASWLRAGGQGNPKGLLCHVAHSLRCSGDAVSFWCGSGQSSRLAHSLTRGPSWWREHLSAEVGSSEKVFGGSVASSLFCPSLSLPVSFRVSLVLQYMLFFEISSCETTQVSGPGQDGGFWSTVP